MENDSRGSQAPDEEEAAYVPAGQVPCRASTIEPTAHQPLPQVQLGSPPVRPGTRQGQQSRNATGANLPGTTREMLCA